MNDTIKEYNGKNTYTNKVCHTLQLGGSWYLVTLNSRVGEGGERGEKQKKYFLGDCPIREVFLRESCPICHPFKLEMEDFKNFRMPCETVTLTFNLT